MTKQQKELVLLGVLLAAILGVGVFLLRKPAPPAPSSTYSAPAISASITRSVVDHPEYASLTQPVDLPLDPGTTGRENPFAPY